MSGAQNESARRGPGAGTTREKQGEAKPSATPRKWQRVLRAFLAGHSFNRFTAARELRDWCLPSTVAELQGRGLKIHRKEEEVPGHYGPVRCCRYWLARESLDLARQLLGEATSPKAAAEELRGSLNIADAGGEE